MLVLLCSARCARALRPRPVTMVNCEACGKKEEELGGGLLMMRCARCYVVFYCDAECQRAHWAAHRAFCKTLAVKIAEETAAPMLSGHDDYDAAALRRAADAGDVGAMNELGICYEFGMGGVGVDAAEGAHWYTRAVEASIPPAEAYCNLANCYYRGYGVLKNLSEAARLWRIAAEMGDPDAQYRLGLCLEVGKGVPYNPVEAFKWHKRAADAGLALAQVEVGKSLLAGLGVPEDKAAGVAYFRRSADQGVAAAMFNLGLCYCTGFGVPRDKPQSAVWFTRARDAGFSDAATALAEIAPTLTPAMRAKVDQLAALLPHTPTSASAGASGGAGGAGAPPPPAPTS